MAPLPSWTPSVDPTGTPSTTSLSDDFVGRAEAMYGASVPPSHRKRYRKQKSKKCKCDPRDPMCDCY